MNLLLSKQNNCPKHIHGYICYYPYKFYEIPFNLIIIGSVFSLIYRIIILQNLNISNFLIELASWLGIFLFYYIVIWVSKGGMGGGDLKLSVYLGIFLGFPNSIYAIYYGFLIGGIFGPFLVLGALGIILFNHQVFG